LADYVIENNGTVNDLEREVKSVLEEIATT